MDKLKKNEVIELDFLKNVEYGLAKNKDMSKETIAMVKTLCFEEE